MKRLPSLFQMAEDSVYRDFVLLEYRAAKAIELERVLAAQERIRAEEAQARAERYAAKLRALGIDSEKLDPDSKDQ